MSQRIAVVGTGISGMSAAWLLSQRADVTVFERAGRMGGHTNTVQARWADGSSTAVDAGFIVYNEQNYPNLTALFAHFGIATREAAMDFAVSLDGGALEYGSASPAAIFAQPGNLVRPRFWSMLRDLLRFYRHAPLDKTLHDGSAISIGQYLEAAGYGPAFLEDHLFPQAAAIWSSSVGSIRDYPAAALVRFFENHGLLKIAGRPQWRTVKGGSASYVEKLTAAYADRVRLGCGVRSLRRLPSGVWVEDDDGTIERFDQVLIATHADQALAMLADPSPAERRLLGAFRYTSNRAVLHTDTALMPRRRAAWSGWNYVGRRGDSEGRCVTYWMNRLQSLRTPEPLFVTLNPHVEPDPDKVQRVEMHDHPLFDAPAMAAQRELWTLQGQRGTWYCGAHFGSGFHEDGLQSGLYAAEAMTGVRRPWRVAEESGRIFLAPPAQPAELAA